VVRLCISEVKSKSLRSSLFRALLSFNASEDHVMKYLVDHLHLTALFHRGDLTEEEAINLDSYYRLHPLPRPAVFTASLGGHTHF
jgi:hypothetical protein